MQVDEQTEFTFDELPEHIKEKARDKWREHDLNYEWWEFVYEDAVTIGALIGIEIGTRHEQYSNGKPHSQPDIYFSGFCSQGDGCCYSGWLNIAELLACGKRLRSHLGDRCADNVLYDLAAEGEALYGTLTARLVALRMVGDWDGQDEVPDGEFSLTGNVAIEGTGSRSYNTRVRPDSCAEELETVMNAYVSGFADWIYAQLEAEHEHLTSDETVDEAIQAAEQKYDEFGSTV